LEDDEQCEDCPEDDVFDPKDAFIPSDQERSLEEEEEDWYTDEESDRADDVQADNGECLEDESNLRYEPF